MTSLSVLDLWTMALVNCAMVAAPFVLVAMLVGIMVSIFQAATQLQENVMTFAPKVAAVGVVLAVAGHWVLGILMDFFREVSMVLVEVGQHAGR